eukprot:2584400-Pyramimonas_sp.AAC.1
MTGRPYLRKQYTRQVSTNWPPLRGVTSEHRGMFTPPEQLPSSAVMPRQNSAPPSNFPPRKRHQMKGAIGLQVDAGERRHVCEAVAQVVGHVDVRLQRRHQMNVSVVVHAMRCDGVD